MHATSEASPVESRGVIAGRLLIWGALAVVVTALVVLLAHQLQQRRFWPIVLAPASLGLLAGLGYGVLARAARVHYPWICVIATLTMAAAGNLLLFRLAYDQYRRDLTSAVGKTQQGGPGSDGLAAWIAAQQMPSARDGDYADRYLETQTGRRGFSGFVIWRAREGMQIGGLHVQGFGMVVVWVIEWLVWASASAVLVAWFAGQPYCKRCESWYDRRSRGRLAPESQNTLIQALSLEDELDPAVSRQEAMEYDLLACSEGCAPPMLILESPATGSTPSARRKVIFKGFLEPAESNTIQSLLLQKGKAGESANPTKRAGGFIPPV